MKKLLFFLSITLCLVSCSCSGGKKIPKEISQSDSSITVFDSLSYITSPPPPPPQPVNISIGEEQPTKMKNIHKGDNEFFDLNSPAIKERKIKKSIKKTYKEKDGLLVYNIPDTMICKKTYIIKVRISRDTTDISIKEGIEPKIFETKVVTSSKMEVNIVDPSPSNNKSFDIVKSNDDKQLVDSSEYTEWVYAITPLKSGKLKLSIVVSIIINNEKKQIVYFDDIIVKSNPKANINDFFKENWKWLSTTIVVPFIIWFYQNKKKKRKNVSKPTSNIKGKS